VNEPNFNRAFYLPRLPREYYQGDAAVHWTIPISHRRRGWLDERFHAAFRELMLHTSLLSGGQQQRLTIARALSQDPALLLLDEFSIAVDPVTTMRIEDVLKELRREVTIVLVTNLVQQARRLADRTAFFLAGELVEVGATEELISGGALDPRTRAYVEGKFG
jgi:ABC-type phosphate transport system ATPase subunit